MNIYRVFAVFTVISLSCFQYFPLVVCHTQFEVGDDIGWVVPPSNDTDFYNDWASTNRFKVTDTLNFSYKKDSVMVVSKEDYENCVSSHPKFFSNAGNTIYILDKPGLYYFISGVSGHCEKGLKMIVKVLDPDSPPAAHESNSTNNTAPTATHKENSGGSVEMMPSFAGYCVAGLLSFFGALLV